jgi:quercetin dioxygenase-like cupin family protein
MNTLEPVRLLEVSPEEFTQTIEDLERDGYRLLMIKPADAPREGLLERNGATVRVNAFPDTTMSKNPPADAGGYAWAVGRAGMMYRDLIPHRLGGKLIASHIRLVEGGPVPDRVHYHKVDFQVIYCLKGAIRVVYEDQGKPFWLRPGDCVLQPPQIRHRVLEAAAGSEVIEITSPAEHETWFDHELELPAQNTSQVRKFGGQRFAWHREETAKYVTRTDSEIEEARTGIKAAGSNLPDVFTRQSFDRRGDFVDIDDPAKQISIMIDGRGLRIDY